MPMQRKPTLFSLLLFVTLAGCEKIDPQEETPSFIRVEQVHLSTNHQQEGSSSHDINDVWVYLNDDLIGPFELPAKIPILAAGQQEVAFRAGIFNNTLQEDRLMYPFLDFSRHQMNLVRDSIISLQPTFHYFPSSQINIWHEDFEDANNYDLQATSESDTTLSVTQQADHVYEGTGSGIVHLTQDKPYFRASTNEAFTPTKGQKFYVEMDYRSTDTIGVGILANSINNTYVRYADVFLKETRDEQGVLRWKKAYLDLTNAVGSEVNASSFEVFIEVIKTDNETPGTICLDNIKVLHQDL